MSENILLNLGDEPRYDQIATADIAPAMQTAMQEARAAIAEVKQQSDITWLNTVERLTDITERVGRIWGVVAHLNSVVDTPELREQYNALMPEVTVFFTEIGQDIELYERFKAIKASPAFARLDDAQQRKLDNDLRGFVLSGAELPSAEQARFAQLQTESAQLSAQFSQNVLDATDAFALYFEDATRLAGLTEDELAMFAVAAQAEGKTGYKIGLQMPHYLAVMKNADDRELRAEIYRAYVTRASELGDAKFDNSANITRCLEIAQEEAQMLGFANYAELSLVSKMADTPAQVQAFLRDLAAKAKPFGEQDYQQVVAFAREHLGLETVEVYDLTYASEKLREAKYAFNESEVKQYFPADKVLEGLFAQIHRLYGVNFIAKKVPTWHDDVVYYELEKGGSLLGGVYMDLYAREGKRGGAWMNDYRGRRRFLGGDKAGSIQTPIAYLVCNFTPPVNGKAARLSHDEIVTLFHEMGHGLHHLLTRVDELGVSGINGVEWDAVELPSQFMENFCWEYDVLAAMSAHESTGEPLPRELFDKMLAAKNFQVGLFLARQMEFALFDMRIYSENQANEWAETLQEVRKEVAVIAAPDYNRFANSFGHIFAGGYSAGYYSYAWAEVLSADAYAAFEESDDVKTTGAKFWNEILAKGGSRSAMDSFKAFRGREPQTDALLRHLGLQAA
ncbi:MAG: M3 family metallopeptidase [Neisseria sp.]|nr:M3 family metallopeptidase [Neisseria sp.]